MEREELIELTNKLYKLTLLFPKKEPLRYKIRELADEILANFVGWQALKNFNPGGLSANLERRYRDLAFLIEKDLKILKSYFELAKWQNWVSYFDILEIEGEYEKFRYKIEQKTKDFERIKEIPRGPSSADKKVEVRRDPTSAISTAKKVEESLNLDKRKEKILKILEEKERIQVWQVKEVLPEVSKRTLRRDFEKLLSQGLIKRIGEKNQTFYKLK